MFYLFLWVLDFLLWILEGKSQVSDISFSFWGPGLTILHGCGFYFNDICGWFLVILSRNRIHEKTLDFDFRFILCDICHFTFSWYFNDFLENCNRKIFNWRILNFFGFPRLGLIIFPKFTWNTFFIQNHFWHIFFQIYVWLSSYLEYFCWILFLNQSWYLLYFFWILFKNSHMEEDLIVSFCPTGRGLSIFPHFSWKRYYYMTSFFSWQLTNEVRFWI